MILHGMYYANEVRDFKQVPRAESVSVKQLELDLGTGLIDQMANDNFEPDKYQDEYQLSVRGMLDEKVKGHEITAAPEAPRKPGGPVIDLMEALKRSLNKGAAPAKSNAATARKRQKAKKAG
jgi:DNA end-binding protein Ku